jgi:hypothetical protein
MSQNKLFRTIGGIIVILVAMSLFACQSEGPIDSTESMIVQKTQELFTRIKVRDYSVIWENEFPYMREESPLEEYLNNPYMKWYQADTLAAVQIDSVTVWEDTAYAHMQLEWLLADSTFDVNSINLRWYHRNDEWVKPTLSIFGRQLEFEEELRVYWEAVERMQREKDEESDQDSGDN